MRKRMRMRTLWIVTGLLVTVALAAPERAQAQISTSGAVGIAGGAALGGLGPLSALVAPVAGPLVGGLVPLVGAIENAPCFFCIGVRVQPKDNDGFLQQYRTGLRVIPGLNTDLIVGAPFEEGGRLTPEETEQVLYVQFGMFDLSLNPESNEVTFGYMSGDQSRLPVLDALPIAAPLQRTDNRLKVGELNAATGVTQ